MISTGIFGSIIGEKSITQKWEVCGLFVWLDMMANAIVINGILEG